MTIYKKLSTFLLIALFSLTVVPSGFVLADDDDNTYGNDEIEAAHSFEDGTHTISGVIILPSVCYEMDLQILVAQSSPEQITLDFDIYEKDSDQVCAQAVVEEDFEVEVDAHEDATFSAKVNGERVELDLEDSDDDSDDDDSDNDSGQDDDDEDDDEDSDEDDDNDSDTRSLMDRVLELLKLVRQLQDRLAEISGRSSVETRQELRQEVKLVRHLSRGMSGDDVRELQELLASDSDIYPEGLITGFYGPLTERAVHRFQIKFKLKASGDVDGQTFSRINEILAEGVGPEGKIPPGLLRAPGIAKKIDVDSIVNDDDEVDEVEGEVESVDLENESVTLVSGLVIELDNNTDIDDDGDLDSLEEVSNALDDDEVVLVEAEGELENPEDSDENTLNATKVKFEIDDSDSDN